MEDDRKKQETVHILEEETLNPSMNTSESKTSSLIRAPTVSVPPNLGAGEEDDEEEEEEDGPRMGDLIRQAMPCRLTRSPSLPSCRIKKEVAAVEGRLPGEPTMTKLTRRSSVNPSFLVAAKHASKGSSASRKSKRHQQIRSSQGLERSMSLKRLSDKEVQGFLELGFAFDKEDLSSTVAGKLASLKIKEEAIVEEEATASGKQKMRPSSSVSEAWNATESCSSPRADTKSSAEDVKAQIKFWARAVTSNVRQECLSPR